MPIDPDKALAPVADLIRVSIPLVGRPQAPFRGLPGLVAFAKAHPGRLNIGQSGSGSLTRLLAVRLGHFASPERNPNLPDVPLMGGVLPGFVGDTACGLSRPPARHRSGFRSGTRRSTSSWTAPKRGRE